MDQGIWAGAGSAIASIMFMWAMASQFFPSQLETHIYKYTSKLLRGFYPFIVITFAEYSGERLTRSEAYSAIQAYLGSSAAENSTRFKAEMDRDEKIVLSMDEHEEVTDDFEGVKVWWTSTKTTTESKGFSWYPAPEEKRYYRLTFHRSHRHLIHYSYLQHVIKQGNAIKIQKRRRKLYTNKSRYSQDNYSYTKHEWTHVPFEHPATFDHIAMDPIKKQDLIKDLLTFRESKDYYSRIGKPWKRGYLLFGPPGTGKSTLIAAMANLLDYDVYDLELTAVKDNTKLRKLLIEVTSKSIILIEDIDCSLNLSGKREREHGERKEKKDDGGGEEVDESKVTLSGLLNFIDGLWSASGSERLIVFTTNYVDKLDPALIRRGRMDAHVELSYCTFQGFKVLARNYLGIEDHALFGEIEGLMDKKNITPADVAENLMPKAKGLQGTGNGQVEACLRDLVQALEDCEQVLKGRGTNLVEVR
ncbi:uncharacterized protein A4U43_C03F27880 [Asparagus officinalis]|uniref:AAA+ ATPase domain-containing protein n=1 Tax=Asparagus officinalis TaxID=4686 RepID=A0A5P1FGA6_ASPOF|nr:AAA-ATPase At3g28580-like [Asparagus officinalis]ONK76437.1 uncharacterized protein A4U43_C03F27880 [Asparagus officinalis]